MEKKIPTEILNAARNLAELHSKSTWGEPMFCSPTGAIFPHTSKQKMFLIEQLPSGRMFNYDITDEVFTYENGLDAYLIKHEFKGIVYLVTIESDKMLVSLLDFNPAP